MFYDECFKIDFLSFMKSNEIIDLQRHKTCMRSVFFCCLVAVRALQNHAYSSYQGIWGLRLSCSCQSNPSLWCKLKSIDNSRLIAMKICGDIHGPQWMNPTDFSHPLSVPVVALWSWHLWFGVKCPPFWVSPCSLVHVSTCPSEWPFFIWPFTQHHQVKISNSSRTLMTLY